MCGGNTTISKLSLKLNGSSGSHFFACHRHSFPTSLTESGLMGNGLKNNSFNLIKLLYFTLEVAMMIVYINKKGEKYV